MTAIASEVVFDGCRSGPTRIWMRLRHRLRSGATQGGGRAEELGSGVIVVKVVKGFGVANSARKRWLDY